LWLSEGGGFRPVALHGLPPALAAERQRDMILRPDPDHPFSRLIHTKQVVHVDDITAEPAYIRGFRPLVSLVDIGGARTLLMGPMLKEQELVGAIAIYRQEPLSLTDKRIYLLLHLPRQALYALEDVRPLNEMGERTTELARSVEELQALGEVSQAVNSTLDLQTVLSTIVAKAVQLSATDGGAIYEFDEDSREFQLRATHGADEAMIAAIQKQGI